jgi:hypothetical protein
VKQRLEAAGLRVELDARNSKMNAKIRDFGLQKVPSSSSSATRKPRPTRSASASAPKATKAASPSLNSSPALQNSSPTTQSGCKEELCRL